MIKDRKSPYSVMARGDPALLFGARGDPEMFRHTRENPLGELLIVSIMTGFKYGKENSAGAEVKKAVLGQLGEIMFNDQLTMINLYNDKSLIINQQ